MKKSQMKEYATIPTTFVGTWITVQGRVMLWQNCTIHTGYVYHP